MQQIIIKSYETKKSVVPAIIFFLIGLILFTNPGGVVEFLSYILGGVFLSIGIGKYISDSKRADKTTGDTFYSFLLVAMGILFIFSTGTLDFLVRIILGLWLIVNGLNTLIVGSHLVKLKSNNFLTIIIGLLLTFMGIYTIAVENLVLSALGLIIMIYGALEIVNYIYISMKMK